MSEEGEPLTVTRGAIIALRAFDACDNVILADAEKRLVAARVARESIQFRRAPARELSALRAAAAPLCIDLGPRELPAAKERTACHASARVFDYGTISVSFELPLRKQIRLEEVWALAADLEESTELSTLAQSEYEELIEKLGDVLGGRHAIGEVQHYVIVIVEELASGATPSDVLGWPALPKLCACERDARAVSPQQRDNVLRYTDSYLNDDLVVIGGACALLVEPSGSREVAEVLELARAQVAQLLHWDDQLDRELDQAYRDVERGYWALAFGSPLGTTLRRLSRRRLELSEFTERIDSALKVIADAYLARVYRKALERFAVPALKNRVGHKQRLLFDIYTTLKDEVALVRSFILEVLIVVLIVTEVVLAFIGK